MDDEWTTEIPDWDEMVRQCPGMIEDDEQSMRDVEDMLAEQKPVWPLGEVSTTMH